MAHAADETAAQRRDRFAAIIRAQYAPAIALRALTIGDAALGGTIKSIADCGRGDRLATIVRANGTTHTAII